MYKFHITTKEGGSKFVWAHTKWDAKKAYVNKMLAFDGTIWDLTEWHITIIRHRKTSYNVKLNICEETKSPYQDDDYLIYKDFIEDLNEDFEDDLSEECSCDLTGICSGISCPYYFSCLH